MRMLFEMTGRGSTAGIRRITRRHHGPLGCVIGTLQALDRGLERAGVFAIQNLKHPKRLLEIDAG